MRQVVGQSICLRERLCLPADDDGTQQKGPHIIPIQKLKQNYFLELG